ncbi:beta-1,3-galactosyltransferase 1-like isoform X2 [Oratosquilla oratoria]|uniref:beta-1,3-galactosyltransferase 1-like isoform X2 n=1 Tax=Oratosquilla oratoria TaxID=337810 RepID=UPI003F76265D
MSYQSYIHLPNSNPDHNHQGSSNEDGSNDEGEHDLVGDKFMTWIMSRTAPSRMKCSQTMFIVLLIMSFTFLLVVYTGSLLPTYSLVMTEFEWPANASRDTTIYLKPDEVTTVIQPIIPCRENLFLLVVVTSAVDNRVQREAIRATWGSWITHSNQTPGDKISQKSKNSQLMFLLGQPRDKSYIQRVVEENHMHKDIIMEGFIDSYTNLTLKSVFMLKWVQQRCQTTRFIMKVDDDMFVNVPNLMTVLMEQKPSDEVMLGALICGARPIYDKKSKWYTPRYLFNDAKYPNYLSGTGYVYSGNLVQSLLHAACETPFFHLEDVYLTGMCAKALGVRLKDNIGFSYHKHKANPCIYKKIVTGHEVTPKELHTLWKFLQEEDCTEFKPSRLRSNDPINCKW